MASLLRMSLENSPLVTTTSAPGDREQDTIGSRELGARAPNLEPLPALDTKPSGNADEREYKDPDLIVRLFYQLQPEPMGKTRETAEPTLTTVPINPPMPTTTIGCYVSTPFTSIFRMRPPV